MIGNPYKGSVQDPILEDTAEVLTLPADGSPDTVDYTVPTGRGKVQAIGIYVASETMEDLADATITISASGKTLFNNSPLLKHSTLYENSRDVAVCEIDEAVPIQIVGRGAANNDINVYVVFFYYDVYITTFSPTAMQAVGK